jgi:hypothetical protein
MEVMKTVLVRFDPSIVVSLAAAGLLVGAFGSPAAWLPALAKTIEVAWLYLSNTR